MCFHDHLLQDRKLWVICRIRNASQYYWGRGPQALECSFFQKEEDFDGRLNSLVGFQEVLRLKCKPPQNLPNSDFILEKGLSTVIFLLKITRFLIINKIIKFSSKLRINCREGDYASSASGIWQNIHVFPHSVKWIGEAFFAGQFKSNKSLSFSSFFSYNGDKIARRVTSEMTTAGLLDLRRGHGGRGRRRNACRDENALRITRTLIVITILLLNK